MEVGLKKQDNKIVDCSKMKHTNPNVEIVLEDKTKL